MEEGLSEEKRAAELDPLSPAYSAWVGWYRLNLGQSDKAIAEARKALDMDPNQIDALFVLGSAYEQKSCSPKPSRPIRSWLRSTRVEIRPCPDIRCGGAHARRAQNCG